MNVLISLPNPLRVQLRRKSDFNRSPVTPIASMDPSMTKHSQIGTTIQELRELRGWSQRELSNRSGICESTIQSYESGDCNPTLQKICAVADAFDARASALLEDAGL